jgi:hypothetical protein
LPADGSQEHHVLCGGHEVEGAQVGHDVAFDGALEREVEILDGLAGREARRPDTDLTAVGLAGGDLTLQAGGQELLVAPSLRAGSLGQAPDGVGERRGLQGPAQVGQLRAGPGRGRGGHQATPVRVA